MSGWKLPAAAGAAAFWVANLVISLTPPARAYRSALAIPYWPMLAEAAVGGLALGIAVAVAVVRLGPHRLARGPVARALWVGLGALLLVTVSIEVPAKLTAGLADPGRWLAVSVLINLIRILALCLVVGWAIRLSERSHR